MKKTNQTLSSPSTANLLHKLKALKPPTPASPAYCHRHRDRRKRIFFSGVWTQQAGPGRLNLLLANPAVLIPRRNPLLICCCHVTHVVIKPRGVPAPPGVRRMPRRARRRRASPPPGSGGGGQLPRSRVGRPIVAGGTGRWRAQPQEETIVQLPRGPRRQHKDPIQSNLMARLIL